VDERSVTLMILKMCSQAGIKDVYHRHTVECNSMCTRTGIKHVYCLFN
jgi:hypothetical protein